MPHRPTAPTTLKTLHPRDMSARWRRRWVYRGLQRSARLLAPRHLGRGIHDFGRTFRFDEIRATRNSRFNIKARIPPGLRFATNRRGPWFVVRGRRIWRPGVETGNYGRAIPTRETHQALRPINLRARFVKQPPTPGVQLVYYDADRQRARTPLRLSVSDLDGDGKLEIVVVPRIFPKYLRPTRDQEDCGVAILRASGSPILRRFFDQPLQDARLLKTHQSKPPLLHVLTADARLRRFDAREKLTSEISLYAMHQRFHREYGRKNTRHPAGLYTLPFAVGVWRPTATGRMQTVISRYVAFSFLRGNDAFHGVRMAGGYLC